MAMNDTATEFAQEVAPAPPARVLQQGARVAFVSTMLTTDKVYIPQGVQGCVTKVMSAEYVRVRPDSDKVGVVEVSVEDVVEMPPLAPRTPVSCQELVLFHTEESQRLPSGSVGVIIRYEADRHRYRIRFQEAGICARVPPHLVTPLVPRPPLPPKQRRSSSSSDSSGSASAPRRRALLRKTTAADKTYSYDDDVSFDDFSMSSASSDRDSCTTSCSDSDNALSNLSKPAPPGILCGALRPKDSPAIRCVTFNVADDEEDEEAARQRRQAWSKRRRTRFSCVTVLPDV